MDYTMIDQVCLNFNKTGIAIINGAISLMMLGVALELKVDDFKRIIVSPKAPLIGLFAQFLLLPALSFFLIMLIRPYPSIALGMILLSACPGGNLSNIMTYLAKGNCAISISMTAVSTFAAIIMTPLNLSFWGNLNPDTAAILKQVSLSPLDLFVTVFVILGIPLTVGMLTGHYLPSLAEKIRKPFKIFSLIFFIFVAGGALIANWQNFLNFVGAIMFVVLIQNFMAFNIGYWAARIAKLPRQDCRAISIEVGIQNSALGLILVFTFFNGLGGMAIVVAWWGIWHIFSGLFTAFLFTRFPLPEKEPAPSSV
jgi:bile acid:Na+ symporter, BASS family